MKVCAEYEDQIAAFTAQRKILEEGVEPDDIEIRSPYPLSEHAVPPHRSKPMIMRNVVRLMWLCGLLGGFAFLTFTQWEWGLTAKTGGQPLVAIPINAIIMYECGMITAILVTTLMFFVETRRYRQLVPPLEEDMVVANGYIALIVAGDKAKKAKEWLEDTNARSVVTYMLPLIISAMMFSGCATGNLRYQAVIKPGEAPADLPAPFSIRMPSLAEQEVKPPQPLGWMYYGDQVAFERAEADYKALETDLNEKVKSKEMKRKDVNKILREKRKGLDEVKPEMLLYKSGVPKETRDAPNPVAYDDASKARGKELYALNCAQCHGVTGKGEGGVGAKWGGPKVVPHLGDASLYGDESKYPDGFFYHNIVVGKNLMPSFGYKLTAKETWDIVNHIRELQGK